MIYNDVDIHSVGGLIYNENGDILVQYHNKYDFWTIPMGKVEGGLTLEETLKKEFKEELDIEVVEFRELTSKKFTYNNIDPKTWKFVEKGETFKSLFHLFQIDNWTGTIKNNEPQKHSEVRFMSIAKLSKFAQKSDSLKTYLEYLENRENRHI